MMGSNFVKRNRHIGWVREEYQNDKKAALNRKSAQAPQYSRHDFLDPPPPPERKE